MVFDTARFGALAGGVLALALAAPGCVTHHVHERVVVRDDVHAQRGHGPPAHAPAHGHRRKHRDAEPRVAVVFDGALGVYVVVGRHDHYWDGSHYLRWTGRDWEVSVSLDRGWTVVAFDDVPPGLRAKHAGRRGKGPHPAKHAY